MFYKSLMHDDYGIEAYCMPIEHLLKTSGTEVLYKSR